MRIRVLTFNVAHGRGLAPHQGLAPVPYVRRTLERIARLLAEIDADIVALQEVDRESAWNGGFDHLELLRHLSGFPHAAFGANAEIGLGRFRLHYGNAVLSRHPILHSDSRRFGDKLVGEKGFLYAEVDLGSHLLPIVSLHLHHRSRLHRRAQAGHLLAWLAHRNHNGANGRPRHRPVILGDFNAPGHVAGEVGQYLLTDGLPLEGYTVAPRGARTFPSLQPLRPLDFALVPRAFRVIDARVVQSRLSDHLPVVVDLELPAAHDR